MSKTTEVQSTKRNQRLWLSLKSALLRGLKGMAKRLWSSLKPSTDTDFNAPVSLLETARKLNVYVSIDKLPFDKYIDALDGKLTVLGEAPEEVLQEAMNELQSQFNEAIGGEEAVVMIERVAEIEELRLRLDRIQLLSAAMRSHPVEAIADQLRQEGYDFAFENVEADLKRVDTRTKNLMVQLTIKEKQIEEQVRDKGSDVSIRESYTRALNQLSDHSRRTILPNEITTYAFCIAYRDMVKNTKRNGRADK